MLAGTLIALAGASSALALSYHGQQPQMHKRALGAVAAVGGHANHLKRDFFEEQPTRMARRVNKSIQRRGEFALQHSTALQHSGRELTPLL